MKICTKCCVSKSLEEFCKDASKSDDRYSSCKQCMHVYAMSRVIDVREYNHTYGQAHREELALYRKTYWRANPEKTKEHNNKRKAQRQNNIVKPLPNNWWNLLINLYGDHCMMPGCVNNDITLDHVIPISLGGMEAMSNFQILCKYHNSCKGNRNSNDYRTFCIV